MFQTVLQLLMVNMQPLSVANRQYVHGLMIQLLTSSVHGTVAASLIGATTS